MKFTTEGLVVIVMAVAAFLGSILGYSQGYADGGSHESRKQVADYNDGWTDGRQDLIDTQWSKHYAGRPCLNASR